MAVRAAWSRIIDGARPSITPEFHERYPTSKERLALWRELADLGEDVGINFLEPGTRTDLYRSMLEDRKARREQRDED